ncbi:MAG TPA: arylamine N-acetyltransferase [Solirubrobacteraceae bacterium]
MLDLNAYLDRIGLDSPQNLAAVHRAHVASIPFENLDPRRGVPVSLDSDALERKLVTGRRGGYCFEQNLLLWAALEALGAEVEPLLARVRFGAPPGVTRPRTHLVLRVHAEGGVWLADVGFGVGTLLEPLPFGPGQAHDQAGWHFRILEDADEHVVQTMADGDWQDLYGFVLQAVPLVDIETSNWFTSTHPRSPFVTSLIVSVQRQDGTRISLSDRAGLALTEQTPTGSTVTPIPWDSVPEILETHFGLSGFAIDDETRIVRLTDG